MSDPNIPNPQNPQSSNNQPTQPPFGYQGPPNQQFRNPQYPPGQPRPIPGGPQDPTYQGPPNMPPQRFPQNVPNSPQNPSLLPNSSNNSLNPKPMNGYIPMQNGVPQGQNIPGQRAPGPQGQYQQPPPNVAARPGQRPGFNPNAPPPGYNPNAPPPGYRGPNGQPQGMPNPQFQQRPAGQPGQPMQRPPGQPGQPMPGQPMQRPPGQPMQGPPGQPMQRPQGPPGQPMQRPGQPMQGPPGQPMQGPPGQPMQGPPGQPMQRPQGPPGQPQQPMQRPLGQPNQPGQPMPRQQGFPGQPMQRPPNQPGQPTQRPQGPPGQPLQPMPRQSVQPGMKSPPDNQRMQAEMQRKQQNRQSADPGIKLQPIQPGIPPSLLSGPNNQPNIQQLKPLHAIPSNQPGIQPMNSSPISNPPTLQPISANNPPGIQPINPGPLQPNTNNTTPPNLQPINPAALSNPPQLQPISVNKPPGIQPITPGPLQPNANNTPPPNLQPINPASLSNPPQLQPISVNKPPGIQPINPGPLQPNITNSPPPNLQPINPTLLQPNITNSPPPNIQPMNPSPPENDEPLQPKSDFQPSSPIQQSEIKPIKPVSPPQIGESPPSYSALQPLQPRQQPSHSPSFGSLPEVHPPNPLIQPAHSPSFGSLNDSILQPLQPLQPSPDHTPPDINISTPPNSVVNGTGSPSDSKSLQSESMTPPQNHLGEPMKSHSPSPNPSQDDTVQFNQYSQYFSEPPASISNLDVPPNPNAQQQTQRKLAFANLPSEGNDAVSDPRKVVLDYGSSTFNDQMFNSDTKLTQDSIKSNSDIETSDEAAPIDGSSDSLQQIEKETNQQPKRSLTIRGDAQSLNINFNDLKNTKFRGRRQTIKECAKPVQSRLRSSSFKEFHAGEIKQEDLIAANAAITELLQTTDLKRFPWNSQYVRSCEPAENPYQDSTALRLASESASQNNEVIKLFSQQARPLLFNTVTEDYPLSPPSPPIMLLSDVKDPSTAHAISEKLPKPNAAVCFLDQEHEKKKTPPPIFEVQNTPIAGLSQRKFVSFRVADIRTEFNLIEPLFFETFIVQDGNQITDEWVFTSKPISTFLPDLTVRYKSVYQLPDKLDGAYLFVVISRYLLPENGAAVNKYYAKPQSKLLAPAKQQTTYFSKYKGVFAPFAFTFVDLKTAVNAKNVQFPQPFPLTMPLKQLYKVMKTKFSDPPYPVWIVMESMSMQDQHLQHFENAETPIIRLATPLRTEPCCYFRHRLILKLGQVTPTGTQRNIYAQIRVKGEYEDLPVLRSPYGTEKVTTLYSRCWYHDKKPNFDEIFSIDLPFPLPSSLTLMLTFYNAQPKNVASGTGFVETMGTATIPLIPNGSAFIQDGEHFYAFDDNTQQPPPRSVQIETLLDSSLISTDAPMNQFFQTVDKDLLMKIDRRELTLNAIPIIDQIVNSLSKIDKCYQNQEKIKQGEELINSFAFLVQNVQLDQHKIEYFMNDYAINFAFRTDETITPEFHRTLFVSWAAFMSHHDMVNRQDNNLIRFFFTLLIKSMYLTKDTDCTNEFSEFVQSWSKYLGPQQIEDYAKFLNLLFDIGGYYYAIYGIECQLAHLLSPSQKNPTASPSLVQFFVIQAFRPKLFYFGIQCVHSFQDNMLDLIRCSKQKGLETLEFIYKPLLRIFAQYDDTISESIANKLIRALTIMSPLKDIPFVPADGYHPIVNFYSFILENITYETFSPWFSQIIKYFEAFFKSLHFVIHSVKDRELMRVVYFAVHHVLSIIVQMDDEEGIIESTNLMYHFLCLDLPLDFLTPLLELFAKIIDAHYENVLLYSKPTLTRQVIRILEISYLTPKSASQFIRALFKTDFELCGNNFRAFAICCRALSCIKSTKVIQLERDLQIYSIVQKMNEMEELAKKQLSEENLTENMRDKALLLFHSPDACVECLNELIEYQKSHDYFAEELQTLMLQASIVLEFLVAQNRMDISYMNLERPCDLFSDLCPSCKQFVCPEGGGFVASSYCDSPHFSERSLINLLLYIINRSFETTQYEIGYYIMDKIWPLIEHRRLWAIATDTFTRINKTYEKISTIPNDEDRLFGHYFRIIFYGSVFGDENGVTYIYREKKLTHLFELTNRLVNHYTEAFKPTQIELIKESGQVDTSKLEPNKGYIQITFVEPYFAKKEMSNRVTSFERNHNLHTFYFDTPFSKSGKAQASIDQQWIRRTFLTVCSPMPTILKRMKVEKSTENEFAPIRVAYRLLRDRINLLKNAIERLDYRAIQQLLHGSLLVQVNEGPSRMAEVFLGEDQEKTKYTEKMKAAFKEFLTINETGLEIHGKWVSENPAFVPLQHELEAGLISLSEKISIYIEI